MHLRSFTTAAVLLSVFFAGAPPAGCQPAAGCGSPAIGQPQPVAYEAEGQPRPPKPDRKKNTCTKSNSPQWKSFQPYRGDIKTNGESGKRLRFYTWDHTHNDIEVWDRRGAHLGSMDPATGSMIKPAEPGRAIEI